MKPNSTFRLTAAVVACGLFFPTLVTLIYFVWMAQAAPALQQATYLICKLVQFGFPVVWVCGLQRRMRQSHTLPSGAAPPTLSRMAGVGLGMGFGLLVLAAALALYHLWLKPVGLFEVPAREVADKVAGFGIERVWQYALLGVFYSLCHAALEEYYWRWFVFGQLRRLTPLWPAIIISSLGFMVHHIFVLAAYFGWTSFATWFFSFSVAIGGAVWAWLYHRSGSLVGPWLSHLLIDAAIFLIGYDLLRGVLQ